MLVSVKQQLHGYRRGHELLASTIQLGREDQDTVDRLSDISGSPGPGDLFAPYITAYPLPSGSYYVLARTWQDLSAPRAGCVLTRSLILPIREWMVAPTIEGYLAQLVPFDRDVPSIQERSASLTKRGIPPVHDERLQELVEALFFEQRLPIVAFGFEQIAEVIAERLLSALWPSSRATFSLSTFSISPRLVGGKNLDLSFAPVAARSRFSGFEGRRIDVAPRAARNRWTTRVADRLFVEPHPRLLDGLAVEMLNLTVRADEKDFRVALLWTELWHQTDHSTSATLGLLDILNSRGLLAAKVTSLRPQIIRSLDLVAVNSETLDVLLFIDTLLGKFAHGELPLSIAVSAMRAAVQLANKDKSAVCRYVQQRGCNEVSWIIKRCLGNVAEPATVFDQLATTPVSQWQSCVMQLCAASRRFARLFVDVPNFDAVAIAFKNFQDVSDSYVCMRVRRNVIPAIHGRHQAFILQHLLAGTDQNVVLYALGSLWQTTQFNCPDFDEILIEAGSSAMTRENFLGELLHFPETVSTNRILCRVLQLEYSNLLWMTSRNDLAPSRVATIVALLIDHGGDNELSVLLKSSETTRLVLAILEPFQEDMADQLARVLLAGSLPANDSLRLTLAVFDRLNDRTKKSLAKATLQRCFSASDPIVHAWLVQLLATSLVSVQEIVGYALDSNIAPKRIDENLSFLNSLPFDLRDGFLAQVADISVRIAATPIWRVGESSIIAWADLLRDAGGKYKQSQITAAWIALEYSLPLTNVAVEPLVVASFPVVYDEIRNGREFPYFSKIVSFYDWDKCKALRRELVNAFTRSIWRPIELLRCAYYTHAVGEILDQLVHQWGGRRYLRTIRRDIEACEEPLRSQLRAAVTEFDDSD